MEHMFEHTFEHTFEENNLPNEMSQNEMSQNEIYQNKEETEKTSDNIFSNIQKFNHEEYQYLNILENIMENGFWEEGRNGKTKSIFGQSMRFSLKDGNIPILTTKILLV